MKKKQIFFHEIFTIFPYLHRQTEYFIVYWGSNYIVFEIQHGTID